MMTKEEIQRSITELQYQYQSLIREGSYKLAQIRKERIKKLREQLKQLSKAKDDDATEHGSIEQYGKGTKTESMGLSEDPVLAQDGGPGSGIKGHRTPEKEEPKKIKASTKLTPSQKEVARYLSEEAELSSPEEIKKAFGEEAPDSYKKSYNNALNFPVGSKAYVGNKKVEIEDYMSDDDGEVIYAMLSNGGMVDASKLRSNKPTKDADPKVAEAQAIINICSGIF